MVKFWKVLAAFMLVALAACSPPAETPSTPAGTDKPEASPSPAATPQARYPSIGDEPAQPGQHAYAFRQASGELVNFLLYLPGDSAPEAERPLIVYLHGHGGIGSNLDKLTDTPLAEMLATREDFPFIVVSPQLPDGLWTSFIDPVDQLLGFLIETLPVDAERIYLTGFSMGSYGAWRYALRYPGRFAALAPVAGGPALALDSTPENICDLKALPIWVFHSEADSTVPVAIDAAAVSVLEACGADIQFTRPPDLDHRDTALAVYHNSDLYDWFLTHSK